MNVAELKTILDKLPDSMPVSFSFESVKDGVDMIYVDNNDGELVFDFDGLYFDYLGGLKKIQRDATVLYDGS